MSDRGKRFAADPPQNEKEKREMIIEAEKTDRSCETAMICAPT